VNQTRTRALRSLLVALVLAGGLVAGCGGTADHGDDDTSPDAGAEADAGRPEPIGSRQLITSGGGVTGSPAFRLRVSLGAPQPAGSMEGAGKRLTLGPAPTPGQ